MNWRELEFFPLMGKPLTFDSAMKLDLSVTNAALNQVDFSSTSAFDRFVFDQLASLNKKYALGGYLEHRAIYQRAEMFATAAEDFRNIHLGVDIWADSGTPVYAPFDAKVHSLQDNAGFADYGPTIILEHVAQGRTFYTLYGHLSRADLDFLEKGQRVIAGELLCHLGPYPENGDWPPHLHFQLIWDLEGKSGDYPGVCSIREKDRYAANCPNPNLILNSEVLG
ncbi:peptidoglycan DD-metalloendopeptidase family protein [Algoriphagus namhaensis]